MCVWPRINYYLECLIFFFSFWLSRLLAAWTVFRFSHSSSANIHPHYLRLTFFRIYFLYSFPWKLANSDHFVLFVLFRPDPFAGLFILVTPINYVTYKLSSRHSVLASFSVPTHIHLNTPVVCSILTARLFVDCRRRRFLSPRKIKFVVFFSFRSKAKAVTSHGSSAWRIR